MTPQRKRLLTIGGALALLAPLVGSPFAAERGTVNIAELASQVEHEEDHVTAIELARWIKDRRPGLRVIDLRTQAQFDSLHIPGAERVELDSLPRLALHHDETVVLYSEAGAHAAQGWVFLRALGIRQVFFLRGGVYEWVDQVLQPTLPVDATDAERVAFTRAAELSRYFGGTPETGVARAVQLKSVAQLRRRGC